MFFSLNYLWFIPKNAQPSLIGNDTESKRKNRLQLSILYNQTEASANNKIDFSLFFLSGRFVFSVWDGCSGYLHSNDFAVKVALFLLTGTVLEKFWKVL